MTGNGNKLRIAPPRLARGVNPIEAHPIDASRMVRAGYRCVWTDFAPNGIAIRQFWVRITPPPPPNANDPQA